MSVEEEPLTEELLGELLSAGDIETYVDRDDLGVPTLPEYLKTLLARKGLKRSQAVTEAGLNATFGYQIFEGQRRASRDKLLRLCFALRTDLREANRLLRCGGVNELSAKSRRDAIIIFALQHDYPLGHVESELYRFGEQTLQ